MMGVLEIGTAIHEVTLDNLSPKFSNKMAPRSGASRAQPNGQGQLHSAKPRVSRFRNDGLLSKKPQNLHAEC